MKIKINCEGDLWVDDVPKYCPFTNNINSPWPYEKCGIWCALFTVLPEKASGKRYVSLCRTNYGANKKDFTDERELI